MAGVTRVNVDAAGALIIGNLSPTVKVNGNPVAVIGASVEVHARGLHRTSIIATGSSTVFAQGQAICRAGDMASCGHAASGSSNVKAG
jgi:uncharacterized Zn-binding protein involved in type VI secretion